MDRNDYYGGDSASLNLTQLFKKYKNGATPPEKLGKDRDYNIDIVPKFMMAAEDLVNILVHTDVTRYLEFKQITGSYVYLITSGLFSKEAKIAKVFFFFFFFVPPCKIIHQRCVLLASAPHDRDGGDYIEPDGSL